LGSPHRRQETSPIGGFLLCSMIADCLCVNAKPEPKRAVLPNVGQDNFIGCSLFFRSGSGQTTFVCLPSDADFHARVQSASIASFNSLLIALFAKIPWPITEVKQPPALASLSAASLPIMPSWALIHSRKTLFNWPSLLRLSLVSLLDLLVMSVEFRVLSAAWLST
jgi:hypothetical protein